MPRSLGLEEVHPVREVGQALATLVDTQQEVHEDNLAPLAKPPTEISE